MKKNSYKKFIVLSLAVMLAVMLLTGCADAEGLHNQKQTIVIFELVNFPLADNEYTISGNWHGTSWDNTRANITVKGGKGASTEQVIKSSYVKFTVTPVRTWGRPWYPATIGNAPDETQGNIRWNFEVHGIPMDTVVTINIDGSSKPAVVTWK